MATPGNHRRETQMECCSMGCHSAPIWLLLISSPMHYLHERKKISSYLEKGGHLSRPLSAKKNLLGMFYQISRFYQQSA